MARVPSVEGLLRFIMRNREPVTSPRPCVDYLAGTLEAPLPFTCERCQRTVYLSDGVRMKKRYPDVAVLCLECLVKEVE
jgi:hypothetical protein